MRLKDTKSVDLRGVSREKIKRREDSPFTPKGYYPLPFTKRYENFLVSRKDTRIRYEKTTDKSPLSKRLQTSLVVPLTRRSFGKRYGVVSLRGTTTPKGYYPDVPRIFSGYGYYPDVPRCTPKG